MQTLLGIDVGGTNTRARAVVLDDLGQMLAHPGMPRDRVEKIASAAELAQFVSGFAGLLGEIAATAIAVAGPISDTSARITNWTGKPELTLAELVQAGLPAESTGLFNDLVAGAHGVLARMDTQDAETFTDLGGPAGPPVLGQGHLVYVAPGTGLGAATLIHCHDARYHAVGCESQHTPAHAPPGHEELHRELVKSLGHAPRWEDAVSGGGLTLLYNVYAAGQVAGIEAQPSAASDAATVASRASAGDPVALQAIKTFYDYLASFCQVLALGVIPCEAVIVGGATTAENLPVLAQTEFARRFADNPVHGELLGKTTATRDRRQHEP